MRFAVPRHAGAAAVGSVVVPAGLWCGQEQNVSYKKYS